VTFKARSFYLGIGIGILMSISVASLFTGMDWYTNPGGIFRSDSGTSWPFVFETWFSWFLPVCLLSVPVVIFVHLWISNRPAKKLNDPVASGDQ